MLCHKKLNFITRVKTTRICFVYDWKYSLNNKFVSKMSDEVKIQFKPTKKKNLRQRKMSSDNEEDCKKDGEAEILAKLEETKEKQRLRNRVNGVNAVSLALGKKVTLEEEVAVKDPFKVQNGGMVNMQALKAGKLKSNVEDAYDLGIGTQFSAETNIGT